MTTSREAMVPAIAKLPVKKYEIRRVSAEANILQVTVLRRLYLRVCISPDRQQLRGLAAQLTHLGPLFPVKCGKSLTQGPTGG